MSEKQAYEGEERRVCGGQLRQFGTPPIQYIAEKRFGGKRPDDLAHPGVRFSEDGPNGETVETTGAELRLALTRFFDRQEGKPYAEKIETLNRSFEASIAPWAEAGLFTAEREARGYRRPDFAKDYQHLFGVGDFKMMVSDAGVNRGYGTLVWAPADVPIASENPDVLTYAKLLKDALVKAFRGTAGGKRPNTLLYGSDMLAHRVDEKNILRTSDIFEQSEFVHNTQNQSGQTDAEMLASLTGIEQTTGGILRLERDQPITPSDIRRRSASGKDWTDFLREGALPENVSAQGIREAIANTIHCLNTEGRVPDYNYVDRFPRHDQKTMALAIGTHNIRDGSFPVAFWDVNDGKFVLGNRSAMDASYGYCMRVGVRKNNVAA